MNDPKKVYDMCRTMVDASKPRSDNHAILNYAYNGGNPWTKDECERDHQHTNVNWLEGTEKIHEARTQCKNALKATENYFVVRIDVGTPYKRREWGDIITKEAQRITKRSRTYSSTIDSSISQMVLHGIGPSTWRNREEWFPRAHSIDDVIVPTDTLVSLENLCHFVLRVKFTVADLLKFTSGTKVDKGWNKPLVNQAIARLKIKLPGTERRDGFDDPTGLVEDWKQNGIYYQSDAVPVLNCFDFYYFDPEKTKWCRRIIVDWSNNQGFIEGDYTGKFLYSNMDLSYGDEIGQILHAQIADGAVVAPAFWPSVRSLGYMLYPMFQHQNRLRCKFMDAVWSDLMWLFKDVSDGDRELIQKIDIRHLGIMPNGLKWIPPGERHTVNFELLNGAMAMNRQLMAENSASFTQNVNDGTVKEMTATETMARVASANKLLTSILADIYDQQTPQYREICRRLAITEHPDCIKFRRRCLSQGVDPGVFEDTESWDIVPERTVGGGDRVLQMAISDKLMELSPRMNPRAQNTALHIAVESVTADASMANELVPMEQPDPAPSAEKATLSWGTLIDGKPVIIGGDVNRIEFVEALITLVDMEFKRINLGGGGMPDQHRVEGLAMVMKTIRGIVDQLATDNTQAERVKRYMAVVSKGENYIKGYVQQLQQQAQANGQGQNGDPQLQADIKSKIITAQSDATISEELAAQKLRHKEDGFTQDQKRKDIKTANEIAAAGARTTVELEGAKARHTIANKET